MRISDWSSDVCSSDLQYLAAVRDQELRGPIDDIVVMHYLPGPEISFDILAVDGKMLKYAARTKLGTGRQHIVSRHPLENQIGRASCRDRVCQYVSISVVAVHLQKKKKHDIEQT